MSGSTCDLSDGIPVALIGALATAASLGEMASM